MTMQELANLAGVTISTVSKAFSGSYEISELMREKIFELAKENKCYYKYRKLFKYKHVIGVIYPEFESGLYSQQLSYLEKEINNRRSLMIAVADNFDKERRKSLVSYFCHMKVSGIIMYGDSEFEEYVSVPVITVGKTDLCEMIVNKLFGKIDNP